MVFLIPAESVVSSPGRVIALSFGRDVELKVLCTRIGSGCK